MHILGQNEYDEDFYKKLLFYFIIECIDDQRLLYAFSKKNKFYEK